MSEQTKIEWADSTVNFWSGCTKVSAGCANCYAAAMDKRHLIEPVIHWGKGAPRLKSMGAVKMALALNRAPLICDACGSACRLKTDWHLTPEGQQCGSEIKHRRRVFSLSRGDWLDAEAPLEWLAEMLDTIRQCDQLQWLLVTKRPELFWGSETATHYIPGRLQAVQESLEDGPLKRWLCLWGNGHPPANVMVLTSVEDQKAADERIPALLKIPAAMRGLSCEPLLGMLNIKDALRCDVPIHWVISGCESGPGRRELDGYTNRARMLRDHCRHAGVPFFHKQMPIGSRVSGDMTQWPEDLRVREFPALARGGRTT
jgi:protein gp37